VVKHRPQAKRRSQSPLKAKRLRKLPSRSRKKKLQNSSSRRRKRMMKSHAESS